MRASESIVVPAARSDVFALVERLDTYPSWLRLVHDVEPVAHEPRPAWAVELRARVGPFTRSKRLRMERIEFEVDRLVAFERAEVDGREHARWALRAELEDDVDVTAGEARGTRLTMQLAYDGSLWGGGLLDAVLAEEVRRARAGLLRRVQAP